MESYAAPEYARAIYTDTPHFHTNTVRHDVDIEPFLPEDEPFIVNIIRKNLDNFEEAGSVLASTFRRLERFTDIYRAEGATYLIVKDHRTGTCIGGAGIGPMAGLPASEKIGEIRDLVIEKSFRGLGIGAQLLAKCLVEAKKIGYRRLYLETTPQMVTAQKLFDRYGFRPITDDASKKTGTDRTSLPCYYMYETPEQDEV